jgi:dihydroflavonol-4-reductase
VREEKRPGTRPYTPGPVEAVNSSDPVFVTGGNGFIGSRVVRFLVESGRRVRCLLRPTSRIERLEGLEFETATGDVRNAESVQRGMDGCSAVIHLAGLSSWSEIASPLMPEVVVGGTRHVLDAAGLETGRRMVFVSSASAINGSKAPVVHDEDTTFTLPLDQFTYPKAKREAEALCRRAASAGLGVVIVNPAEVYGPNDTSLITASSLVDFANSRPAVVCNGGTSVVHVDDVARGIVAALERGRGGERYILGGENRSVEQIARETLDILGRPARILKVPNAVLRLVGRVGGALRIPLPLNPAVIPYATLYWYMSSAKAERELGVRFRGARATLQDTVGWLRDAGHIH